MTEVDRFTAVTAATVRTTVAAAPAGAAGQTADRTALRGVLGQFATGIAVVAASVEGVPCGMTVNSFTSVSLDPALVLVCINRTAAVHQAILAEGNFTISVLAADQERQAKYFADRDRPRGHAEFAPVDWYPGPYTGAPVLSGALASLECGLHEVHRGGDHSIFLGEVLSITRGLADEALVFFRGKFRRLDPVFGAQRHAG